MPPGPIGASHFASSLLRQLPQKHANAFHHLTRAEYEAAAAALRSRVASSNASTFSAAMNNAAFW